MGFFAVPFGAGGLDFPARPEGLGPAVMMIATLGIFPFMGIGLPFMGIFPGPGGISGLGGISVVSAAPVFLGAIPGATNLLSLFRAAIPHPSFVQRTRTPSVPHQPGHSRITATVMATFGLAVPGVTPAT